MEITLNKETPKKSYKASLSDSMPFHCACGLILLLSWSFITNTEEITTFIKITAIMVIALPSIFVFYCLTWKFEIYATHFSQCLEIFFIPFKITLDKIMFDDINWVDGKKIKGIAKGVSFEHLHIEIYLRNKKLKEYFFLGKENEFYDIIYNWENISGYIK